MSGYLSGHHARVDDAHIQAIVQSQTTVDDPTKVAPHHGARPDGVRDSNEIVPNPAAPVRVRAASGVVWYAVESRKGLARREGGEGCSAEQTTDETRHGNLGLHVSFNAEWVDMNLGVGERIVIEDLDCTTAKGKEWPGVYTYCIGVARVVEELGNRSYRTWVSVFVKYIGLGEEDQPFLLTMRSFWMPKMVVNAAADAP
jgi:hypothetical protein